MRLMISMFFFIMCAQVVLLFQTWYNNIFGLEEQRPVKPLSLTIGV